MQGVDVVTADFTEYPQRATKALVRALNRGMTSGRAVMARAIADDIGLRVKAVRDALRFAPASFGKPQSELAASLKPIPLINFSARGPEPSRGKGRGVTYRLTGSRGRHPNAFIATMTTGHRGVFARKTTKRLPIRELFGPSLGRVFAKYRQQALEAAQASFVKNFDHEMAFQNSQGGSDGAGAD